MVLHLRFDFGCDCFCNECLHAMKSKAILEFDYPEDEHKLMFAVKGVDMYATLANIKLAITREFKHKADMEAALLRVRELTDEMLAELNK
jgi:hypothetical protein